MPTKEEIVISIANMLNERYDRNHNVTNQPVVVRHLQETFHFRRHICRETTLKLCNFLEESGIFQPYTINDKPIEKTWCINFDELTQFLEDRE